MAIMRQAGNGNRSAVQHDDRWNDSDPVAGLCQSDQRLWRSALQQDAQFHVHRLTCLFEQLASLKFWSKHEQPLSRNV